MFAIPGPDAATNGLTLWPGNGLYIPATVEGEKLEAAKRFVAFQATQPGCDAYASGSPPQGPFLTPECQLPAQVSQVAKDTQEYVRAGKTTPALEYLSPVKGRRWSRSASRWAPARSTPPRVPSCTTRT